MQIGISAFMDSRPLDQHDDRLQEHGGSRLGSQRQNEVVEATIGVLGHNHDALVLPPVVGRAHILLVLTLVVQL